MQQQIRQLENLNVKLCDLCVQILVPYENRTSESMYNRYSVSRLHRHIPEVSQTHVKRCWHLILLHY